MYNLSISFGPTGTIWAFLFKEEEKAGVIYNAYVEFKNNKPESNGMLIGSDDFGQTFAFDINEIRGILLEDLEQIEAARIQRALIDERCKAKFMKAAQDDQVIRAASRQGTPIMTPMGMRGN